jgi:hypothetical protein
MSFQSEILRSNDVTSTLYASLYAGDGTRLTWDPDCSVLFESAWSLACKICALNYITVDVLCRLIRKPDAVIPSGCPRFARFYDSTWIDFDRFSELLGVSVDSLKTGFLDQLGFHPKQRTQWTLRRCPQCWQAGFHCVFFDLAIIDECPWHRAKLLDPCMHCIDVVTIDPVLTDAYHPRLCPVCYHHSLAREFLTTEKLPSQVAATVLGYCVELKQWWANVRSAVPHSDFIQALMTVGARVPNSSQLQLGLAHAVAPTTLYWKFTVSAVPARLLGWTRDMPAHDTENIAESVKNDIVSTYKAVSRYLRNRVAKRHRRCIDHLTKYSREECFCLDASKVCRVALAYVCWERSLIGFHQLACHERSPDLSSDVWATIVETTEMGNEAGHWLYAHFCRILGELDIQREVFKLRVCRASDSFSNRVTHRLSVCCHDGKQTTNVHAFIPHAKVLIERQPDCGKLHDAETDSIDLRAIWTLLQWGWANQSQVPPDTEFVLRQERSKGPAGQFFHIYI